MFGFGRQGRRNKCQTEQFRIDPADIHTAYAWGLNLDEWNALPELVRADKRKFIVNAPRFEAGK